jgi:ketosteroid isomerase-like protein
MPHPRDEVQAAVDRYLAVRAAIDDGQGTWADLAAFFTDDAVFIDPAWGRCVGLEEMRRTVLGDAMEGLDWTFPVDYVLIDGDTVVVKWREVIPGADGRPWEQSGISTLIYAGDGRFRYEEDLLNMAHVLEDMAASGWRPSEGTRMHMPPEHPNRDFSVPGDRPEGWLPA